MTTKQSSNKRWWIFGIVAIVVISVLLVASDSKQEDAVVPTKTREYQEVFTFNGNGAKKSEPFFIVGEKFKIVYDCKGALCQVFIHELISGSTDVVMNSTQSISDETTLYGIGEYYLEANTLGDFKMTVYDYRNEE